MEAKYYPWIDPVILSIGSLELRWYSLAYMVGFLAALFFAKRNLKIANKLGIKNSGEAKDYDDFLFYGILGVILGGRIGYVLIYNLPYYSGHLSQAFKIWQGGMSFHGALIGYSIALTAFCRVRKINMFTFADMAALGITIGIFLGRLANFINGELWGRVTDHAFGVVFPLAGDIARHPSQIYEAIFEGLIAFILLYFLIYKTQIIKFRGMVASIFLSYYGIARFFIEYTREPDEQIGLLMLNLSMGQILCLIMIAVGGFLSYLSYKYYQKEYK